MNTITLDPTIPDEEGLVVEAVDVTGTHVVKARNVNPAIPAEALAGAFASRMQLAKVPWMLRSDRTGAYLDEEKSIGEQVEEAGTRVVITPKTHLGLA